MTDETDQMELLDDDQIVSDNEQEQDSQDHSDDSVDSTSEDNAQQFEDETPLSEDVEKRINAAAAAARKRADHNWQQKVNVLNKELDLAKYGAVQNVDGDSVQDPLTGQLHDISSTRGQVIMYQRELDEVKNEQVQYAKAQEAQKSYESFVDKVSSASSRYSDFQESFESVDREASTEIGAAIQESTIPGAMINYLGKNREELTRISKLTPAVQKRELYKLEESLVNRRKKISSASAPVSGSKANRNGGANMATLSDDDYIQRRKAQLMKSKGG